MPTPSMALPCAPPPPRPWVAAWITALLTVAAGTVLLWLGSGRIGRDPGTDWSVVATLLLRDAAMQDPPRAPVIAAGLLLNQATEVGWALLFFVGLRRWTGRWSGPQLLLAWWPWAGATATVEWLLLMPLLPFAQPVFTLEHPLWMGWMVHAVSTALYPLFPWIRDRREGRRPIPSTRFARGWLGLFVAGTVALAALAAAARLDREWPHLGDREEADRTWMRRLGAHHAQGLQLARLAEERAASPRLRALSRLMAANQQADLQAFARFWRSWWDGPPDFVCTPSELAAMPGWLSAAELERLRNLRGEAFDRAFVPLMTRHHQGAVAMADQGWRQAGDLRLRLAAHAIRHAQRGEIALMHGATAFPAVAVALAWRAMVDPAGEHPMDRREHALPTGQP